MSWKTAFEEKLVSLEKAASVIKSGDRIISTTMSSMPIDLLIAIGNRHEELRDVMISSQVVLYPFEWLKKDYAGHIRMHTTFMGVAERNRYDEGNVDITSYQFSRSEWLIKNRIKPTVMVAEVSPPNENGFMSLGPVGSLYGKCAATEAATVICQVNPKVPFVSGGQDSFLHVSEVDFICKSNRDLVEFLQPPVLEEEEKIARHIMPYIKDGATIQLGLGGVANAVGFGLKDHKHLGVHSEMLTDSMVDLVKKGVIDGSRKTIHPGKLLISFGYGSQALYDFMDKNDLIEAQPIYYVANANVVARHKDFVSINSCIACDLTGQVGSESIGFRQFSGTGGQLDFVRGAVASEGGRSFLCMRSTTQKKDGTLVSKITAALPPGTAVTTPRTDADCIVTEYGVAEVRDKSFAERARALIAIAHPQFRDQLEREAKEHKILF
jgi:Acetyl-CoA hydrolase